MGLSTLPSELLIHVARFLDTRDAMNICTSSRRLYTTLHDFVVSRHVRHMPYGGRPLWWAVELGCLSLARKALRAGVDPNEFVNWGDDVADGGPLMVAAGGEHDNDAEMVELLLKHGADPAAANKEHTALSLAAQRGSLDVLRLLLDTPSGSSLVNALNAYGSSPLHEASVIFDQVDVCRLLLERGAKLEARNCIGNTPLLDAICNGAADTVAFLLNEAGADPLRISHRHGNCLSLAVRACSTLDTHKAGPLACLEILLDTLKNGKPEWRELLEGPSSELHELLLTATVPALRLLLDAGIPADSLQYGRTPLWHAAGLDDLWDEETPPAAIPDVSREESLIAYGADVNFAHAETQQTVLMQAVERSSAPVVELLLSKGANVDAIDTNYRTAHDLAVFLELDEMAALLLAHKANLEKARQ